MATSANNELSSKDFFFFLNIYEQVLFVIARNRNNYGNNVGLQGMLTTKEEKVSRPSVSS